MVEIYQHEVRPEVGEETHVYEFIRISKAARPCASTAEGTPPEQVGTDRTCVLPSYSCAGMTAFPDMLDFGPSAPIPYLVLSWRGDDSANRVLKAVPLDVEACYAIAQQSLCALKSLHGIGVIHGDFKPSNVVIRKEDRHVSLVDFGFSERIGCVRQRSVYYTVGYRPPELCHPSTRTDSTRSRLGDVKLSSAHFAWDAFAWGCVLGEIARGKPLYLERNIPSSGLSQSMWDWIQQGEAGQLWRMKCLESWISRNKDFRDRWQVGMTTPLKDYLVGSLHPRPEQRSTFWNRIEPQTCFLCEDSSSKHL